MPSNTVCYNNFILKILTYLKITKFRNLKIFGQDTMKNQNKNALLSYLFQDIGVEGLNFI